MHLKTFIDINANKIEKRHRLLLKYSYYERTGKSSFLKRGRFIGGLWRSTIFERQKAEALNYLNVSSISFYPNTQANTQLHPDSVCVERFSRIPLLRNRFRAIDFMDRFNQTLTERVYVGSRPKLRAPLVSPFFECLSHQPVIPSPAISSPTGRTWGNSAAKFSDSGGFASLIRKSSKASLPAQVSFSSILSTYVISVDVNLRFWVIQYSDNLLEKVINCSRVCSASTNINNTTIHTGTSITSGAAKSISHSSQVSYSSGVFSNGILLSSSMASPYEWNWESLASWGRRLSSSGSVLFSWNDQSSQK